MSFENPPVRIRQHTPEFSTAGQIRAADVAQLAQQGFRTVINNRPDFEEGPSQPTSDEIAAAAQAHGLRYFHIPVSPSRMNPEQVRDMQRRLLEGPHPVLAFCRSGTRSTVLYLLASQRSRDYPHEP